MVLVQGDTISVLAGALAANKLKIKIGHHEAGLRSHDLTMLEETNRIITDHISDYLFAPTDDALNNLYDEGITSDKVFLTGNTIVDAVSQNLALAEKKVDILEKLNLKKKNYILVTVHRSENVDNAIRLKGIIEGLNLVSREFQLPIIFPVHPHTTNSLNQFGLNANYIQLIQPLGYLEFMQLEAKAKLIITDSGGLQEEACILKIPCVTVRDNTERPETIKAKINILAGADPKRILAAANEMIKNSRQWVNPFGSGDAAQKILSLIEEQLKKL